MTRIKTDFSEGLYFVPLGGSEQFGVNFNLYGCDGQWIAFDCGIGFADHRYPNVDILLPDPSFIEARRKDLTALVITHAHEDHIGAVPYLWPRLQCPIYCTPFTAAVLREKFHDHPECKRAKIIEIKNGQKTTVGPFDLHFLHVTHSIPQPVATVIETKYGRIVHSGDWNLDPHPVLDEPVSAQAFKTVGEAGVLAYVGDSTNSPIAGRAGSESDVERGLSQLFKECHGRIAITIFASNVGRIKSIAKAAKSSGRSVCILGRSLHRMTAAARNCGYLNDIDAFVPEGDLGYIPLDNVVLIVTGSQGEAMAALARISRGEWQEIKLGRGDTVVFSSRAIPGNEVEINEVKNNLSAAKVQIVDPDNTKHKIHVSGHPYADEVRDMIGWIKPQTVIPVHGERLMLEAQAEIARSLNVPHVIIPNNGSVIRIAPGSPETVDHVETGLLAVEPNRIVNANHKSINDRRKLQFSGAAHVTVAINRKGELVFDPQVTLLGLIDESDEEELNVIENIQSEVEDILARLNDNRVRDNAKIDEELRIGVRRLLTRNFGFKPKVSIHLLRV